MKKVLIVGLILIILIVISVIIVLNFSKTNISFGLVGTLTGKISYQGTTVRNGFLMAFDEFSNDGEIKNYDVEIIIMDDTNDPDTLKKVTQELIDGDVTAIIGPGTSGLAAEVLPLANENEVLFIAPSVSSNIFTGIDDYLIRVVTSSNISGQKLAEYLKNNTDITNTVIVYDENNEAYCLDIIETFKDTFSDDNHLITDILTFKSEEVIFKDLVTDIKNINPDSVFIIAGAADTSSFAQNIMIEDLDTQILATAWAKQNELISSGGNTVEGIIITANFDENKDDSDFQNFKVKYFEKYGRFPNSGAVRGYEIGSLIFDILQNNPDVNREKIKSLILQKSSFNGLQGDIVFDEFGDVIREMYIMTIQDGEFVILESY